MHSLRHLTRASAALLLLSGTLMVAQGMQGPGASAGACGAGACAYLDASLPAEQRAADLVGRMTLEEKVLQTIDRAPAIPRLGVPEYNWWNEALHGVARAGYATTFPQAIGLAATWDTALLGQVGETISTEGRAKYNEALRHNDHSRYAGLTFWSPNVNIFRDPRWGRGQETYGEDPYLTGRMGVAFVKGVQGEDPHYLKAVATPKHFAVHSGPEPARHGFNVDVSPHDLEDTYLPAFRAAMIEGKADSIMCAYNAIDGAPACASDLLLGKTLRGDWKFSGFVVSDCDAVADVARGHHFAPDNAHASAVSLKAGTDLDCGDAYKQLLPAVKQGLLTEKDLDVSLVRLYTARFRLGMFDPAGRVPFNTIAMSEVDSAAHRAVALRAARESIVLLQNRAGVLPLGTPKRIAVIGPTAELIQAIEGNYTAAAPRPVMPLEGIEKGFAGAQVSFAPGSVLAEGLRTPVPATALRQAVDSQMPGLKAEYFESMDMSGAPKLTRTDRTVNFSWNRVGPAAEMPATKFSARWTGAFVPPGVGEYTLAFRGAAAPRRTAARVVDPTGENAGPPPATSAVKVYLDDQLILDSSNGKMQAKQMFSDTRPHALRIEYVRASEDRYVSLEWLPPAQPLLEQAVEVAKRSDVIVAFVGLSPDLEGEEMNVHVDGFDGGDRTDIGLPAAQQHLLEALKATGKPLVVVLTSGSALAANWADKNADAVLEAWYGGEEAGTAIADTLAGRSNPSGRLPVTFYNDVSELPPFADYAMRNRTYRYFGGQVLYPFGYGLSYSRFGYAKPALSAAQVAAGAPVTVSVDLRNAGKLAGDEIAEVYVQAPGAGEGAQPFLAAFQRVHLGAGESKRVSIPIDARQLSRVTEAGVRRISEGAYTISIGGGQPGHAAVVSAVLQVKGSMELPR